jgi:putative transcriptional regulator
LYSTTQALAAGDCVIAPPRIRDSQFAKSVILLTNQRAGGDFGLCLNRPSGHTLGDLSLELDCDLEDNIPLYWGGPVGTQTIWMLHTPEWSIDQTVKVNSDWSMTSHQSMFHHLADGDRPDYFRMTFGFCGWARGQLKSELEGQPPYSVDSSWLVWQQTTSDILTLPPEELWRISCEQSSHQAVNNWMS